MKFSIPITYRVPHCEPQTLTYEIEADTAGAAMIKFKSQMTKVHVGDPVPSGRAKLTLPVKAA